jgi:hypothetical protein
VEGQPKLQMAVDRSTVNGRLLPPAFLWKVKNKMTKSDVPFTDLPQHIFFATCFLLHLHPPRWFF